MITWHAPSREMAARIAVDHEKYGRLIKLIGGRID
jgi:hypothetical protein